MAGPAARSWVAAASSLAWWHGSLARWHGSLAWWHFSRVWGKSLGRKVEGEGSGSAGCCEDDHSCQQQQDEKTHHHFQNLLHAAKSGRLKSSSQKKKNIMVFPIRLASTFQPLLKIPMVFGVFSPSGVVCIHQLGRQSWCCRCRMVPQEKFATEPCKIPLGCFNDLLGMKYYPGI